MIRLTQSSEPLAAAVNPDTGEHPEQPVAAESSTVQPTGRFRWFICALLLLGVTINYMDRQILGVFKTTLQHDLGWNEIDYSNLVFVFQAMYAAGLLLVGRLMDPLGTRFGYALAMIFWSAASMATGVCRSLVSFMAARSALGFAEAGVFPASIKAVAEWFPKRERALATGVFNSGTNIGAVLTPVIAPLLTKWVGWRWAFFIIGSVGFLWLAAWLAAYRTPEAHSRCSPAELAYIRSDPQEAVTRISWRSLVPHRQMWAVAVGKFCTDPIWWFYLFWMPDFLQRTYKLNLLQAGLPLAGMYTMATLGSVGGGWLSSSLIKRGAGVNAGRKTAMLISALCVLPILVAYHTTGLWLAVLIVGLAMAAHQGFSANLFTLASDMFPSRAVGTVTGIGGMAGAIGGMLIAKIVGYALQWTGSYLIPFFIAGLAYLVALGLIQLLAPRLEPANIE